MENSYGIGVANRYELFYDNDVDPLDIINQSAKKKEKNAGKENKVAEKKTKSAAPAKKTPKPEIVTKSSEITESKPKSKTIRNNDARVKFSDREERNNRRNPTEGEFKESQENSNVQRFDGESRGRGMAGRGFSRGARGGRRGTRGSGADFRGGKRDFDRQSGMVTSGVKAVDKRDGSGSYNWGSDKEQITDEQANHANNSSDNDKSGLEETINGHEEQVKEEDTQKEMTLDEWKALHKREKPVFKTRRAGEGENTSQWKKTYVLKKKIDESSDEEVEEDNDGEEESSEEEVVHHGRKKVLIPIDFQFSDSLTRGRGRGRGRGGPGRGRGMGRGRGSRFQAPLRQEAPKMDDERDFPSLN